jgi:hypothetical protein
MTHEPAKHNGRPPLKLRPLSPDHPLNDPTPVWVRAVTKAMLKLMRRMAAVAREQATQSPSRTGLYAISVLVSAEGGLVCDCNGVPVIVPSPLEVLAVDPEKDAVVFSQLNQLVKRAEAAKIAATSGSTLKRAEANGELRPFKVGDRDTSYLMIDLNGWIFKRAMKGEGKR